ncbi:phage tail tube protein [Rhizobium sp. CNPSo 4062]|uniref:phage tail tube protein n=1 Tax=Rhizobium sp. CNPSo 4062 TaxID=3021410 RepID=UPI00254C0155|nr:phage tail tube protein [Rhizobium sp. CNPSo 4062]MDK4704329.1 phage tail tube protein [Rhizobium sp. CNPSo 4062]
MARAVTENFAEMVLEVETEVAGTFARICGLTSRNVNRASNMSTSEVPDCDDEALPAVVERAVQSQEVTIAATGVWAKQSHGMMMDWWYSGATKNIRIGHLKADVGETQYETGPAYLVNLNNAAERGQKVTAEIDIQFDGLPTRTAAVAGP